MEIWAVIIFTLFVVFVLGLSFYFANKAKSASGYFAAGGQIHWSVNGVAFAGDYLSAASFLGICGMIASVGYDGFLYSIGFLAGWIVALFIVAEPMKRLGKYTFTDALDSKFNHKGIQFLCCFSYCQQYIFADRVELQHIKYHRNGDVDNLGDIRDKSSPIIKFKHR